MGSEMCIRDRLILTFFLLRSRKISLKPNQPKLLILRGIIGVTSMSLFFLGIHFIPIGSAVTIRYIAPLFGAVLAVYFLNERIFPLQWFFYVLAFFGVVLIKGFDASISLFGVGVVLGAAFFSAIVYIIISKIGCLLYTSPSPRDLSTSRMPSSA